MSPRISRQRKLSKRQLKMAKLYGCTALGHSLALRMTGYVWRDLISLRPISGMEMCGLLLGKLRR
jgi:hypothetical protein